MIRFVECDDVVDTHRGSQQEILENLNIDAKLTKSWSHGIFKSAPRCTAPVKCTKLSNSYVRLSFSMKTIHAKIVAMFHEI